MWEVCLGGLIGTFDELVAMREHEEIEADVDFLRVGLVLGSLDIVKFIPRGIIITCMVRAVSHTSSGHSYLGR